MSSFDPYADNGGTCLAIAGKDFCVVAADTRQSDGYLINSRNSTKIYSLNRSCSVTISGFHADGQRLVKAILTSMSEYKANNNCEPDIHSVAHLVSFILYSKRFFPYYTFPILAGLDSKGNGVVYSYDPVGSFEREPLRVSGSAASLVQPFVDSIIRAKPSSPAAPSLTMEDTIKLACDSFVAAAERDIYTGDQVQLFCFSSQGVSEKVFPLRND